MRAWGLRLRGAGQDLALSIPSAWPSAYPDCVGAPERFFRSSIASLHVPLSTLHGNPCGAPRMTRGQDGSLLLSCTTLSFVTLCRFVPAHQDTILPHLFQLTACLATGCASTISSTAALNGIPSDRMAQIDIRYQPKERDA